MNLYSLLATCILVFVGYCAASAQEYRTILFNGEAYYSFEDADFCGKGNTCLRSYRIDSTNIQGTDTILYSHRVVKEKSGLPGGCDYTVNGTPWIGEKIVMTDNDYNLFFNEDMDTIQIKTNAVQTSVWDFINIDTSNYIEASVASQGCCVSVLGEFQLFTKSRLIAKKQNGDTIPHPINGKEMELVFHVGLAKFFNVLNFPVDTTTYSVFGLSRPSFTSLGVPSQDTLNPKFPDFFNFLVGQEFHYKIVEHTGTQNNRTKTITFLKRLVIDKWASNEKDSIRYKFYQSKTDYITEPDGQKDTVFTNDTISKLYIHKQYDFLDKMSREFVRDGRHSTGFVKAFLSDEYKGRFQKEIPENFSYDSTNQCLSEKSRSFPVHSYANRIGLTFYENGGADTSYDYTSKKLIYYQRGIETWGTPFNFNRFVSAEHKPNLVNQLHVFPNPVDDKLYVYLQNLNRYDHVQINLYDVMGRKMWAKEVNPSAIQKVQIPFISKGTGIYFLKVSSPSIEKAAYVQKIVNK